MGVTGTDTYTYYRYVPVLRYGTVLAVQLPYAGLLQPYPYPYPYYRFRTFGSLHREPQMMMTHARQRCHPKTPCERMDTDTDRSIPTPLPSPQRVIWCERPTGTHPCPHHDSTSTPQDLLDNRWNSYPLGMFRTFATRQFLFYSTQQGRCCIGILVTLRIEPTNIDYSIHQRAIQA
jgi:hypothetical protein